MIRWVFILAVAGLFVSLAVSVQQGRRTHDRLREYIEAHDCYPLPTAPHQRQAWQCHDGIKLPQWKR